MTLGGTDKKGGPRDRLSWHHAATFQCNHRRSRLTQLLSFVVLAPLLLSPRRPLPFHFRDRPLLSPFAFSACARSLFYPVLFLSFLAHPRRILGSLDLCVSLPVSLFFFNRLSRFCQSDAPRCFLSELSRFTGRSSEVRSRATAGEGVERREGEARRAGGARRARRRIRSIPTTERRHRESLLRNGAKQPLVILRSSCDSCVLSHVGCLGLAGA